MSKAVAAVLRTNPNPSQAAQAPQAATNPPRLRTLGIDRNHLRSLPFRPAMQRARAQECRDSMVRLPAA